jgi:hypothetical protein
MPDIVQIRQIFENKENAIIWEHKVLRRMGVTKKDQWINRTDNKSINGSKEAYSKASKAKWTNNEYREKISSSTKSLWQNEEWVKQTREKAKKTVKYKKENNLYVKQKRTEEQKENYRLAALKRWQNKESRLNQSNAVKKSWLDREKLKKDQTTGRFLCS